MSYGDTKFAFGDVQRWNFKENYVQADENQGFSANFLKGESTLVAIGPASAFGATGATEGTMQSSKIVGIGLTPQIGIQQSLPVQRIFEIGSRRAHFLDGIPMGGGSMGRLLYNGPSLLRALYFVSYEKNGDITDIAIDGLGPTGTANPNQQYLKEVFSSYNSRASAIFKNNKNNYLWLSLWDERLTLPFGMCLIFKDGGGRYAGALYLENCKVTGHNFGVQAGANMLMENLQFMFDRAVPVFVAPVGTTV